MEKLTHKLGGRALGVVQESAPAFLPFCLMCRPVLDLVKLT